MTPLEKAAEDLARSVHVYISSYGNVASIEALLASLKAYEAARAQPVEPAQFVHAFVEGEHLLNFEKLGAISIPIYAKAKDCDPEYGRAVELFISKHAPRADPQAVTVDELGEWYKRAEWNGSYDILMINKAEILRERAEKEQQQREGKAT